MGNVGFLPIAYSMFLAHYDYRKFLMASEEYI